MGELMVRFTEGFDVFVVFGFGKSGWMVECVMGFVAVGVCTVVV